MCPPIMSVANIASGLRHPAQPVHRHSAADVLGIRESEGLLRRYVEAPDLTCYCRGQTCTCLFYSEIYSLMFDFCAGLI